MSLCNILAVSWGYFAKLISDCTALYHSFTDWLPCLKLVRKSNLALISFVCGLQNSSNFCQIISKHISSGAKSHEMYWSMPKSPDQATTFLHFLPSDSITSSHSKIFSHFISQAIINSPVYFRTFYVGDIHTCVSLWWSYEHFLFSIWFLLITCLLFWINSVFCVLLMLGIMVCFRHLGTSWCVKQLQALFILVSSSVFNWLSQLFMTCGTLELLVFRSLLLYSGSLSISSCQWAFHTMTSCIFFLFFF